MKQFWAVLVVLIVFVSCNPSSETVDGMKRRVQLANDWAIYNELPNYKMNCVHYTFMTALTKCSISYDTPAGRRVEGIECTNAGCYKPDR
jgi:hypothetical protein